MPSAALALGMIYLDEKAGRFDYDKGQSFLRRAADAGLADAQFNMGLLSAGAFGNPPDSRWPPNGSARPRTRAMPRAMYNLGVLYLEGKGVEKNAIEAAQADRQAAEKGNADAMLDYGVLVFRGEGVQQRREDRRAVAAALRQARQHHRAEPRGEALCLRQGRSRPMASKR